MRRSLPLIVCATLVLTGCARLQESRLNPLNWFGASAPAATPVDENGDIRPLVPSSTQLIDNRVVIDQITGLTIGQTPEGAIVTATGIGSAQGQFNAQMVPVRFENGVLTLSFRVEIPTGAMTIGSDASRQITVARVLDQDALRGVRTIRVEAARNARTTRR